MAEIIRMAPGLSRRRTAARKARIDRERVRSCRRRAHRTGDPCDVDDLVRALDQIEQTLGPPPAPTRDGNPPSAGTGHAFKACGGKRHLKQRLRQGSPRKGKGRGGRVGTARLDPQHERPSRVEVKGPGLRRGILDVIAGVKHG